MSVGKKHVLFRAHQCQPSQRSRPLGVGAEGAEANVVSSELAPMGITRSLQQTFPNFCVPAPAPQFTPSAGLPQMG